MAERIRIGVVGCGEATQILHIPTLVELRDLFAVTALCDVSPLVLEGVGGALPGARLYSDPAELLADADVDAVLVANPDAYHADTVVAAIAAGKHVLLEKPIGVTLGDVDAMIAAERSANVTVQVGYMRRYAPAYVEAAERIAETRGDIVLARVHDVIGPNAAIIDHTSNVYRGTDVPKAVFEEGRARLSAKISEAIGVGTGDLAAAYGLLLSLSSHALSAMRGLIGMPKGVLYAAQHHDGRFLSAAFDYGHFVCHFEAGVDEIPHFDAHIEVYTPKRILKLTYDTPYIRHRPTMLTTTSAATAAGVTVEDTYLTRNDSFVAEWRAFHRNVMTGGTPKTTLEDARNDLDLARQIAVRMGEAR